MLLLQGENFFASKVLGISLGKFEFMIAPVVGTSRWSGDLRSYIFAGINSILEVMVDRSV